MQTRAELVSDAFDEPRSNIRVLAWHRQQPCLDLRQGDLWNTSNEPSQRACDERPSGARNSLEVDQAIRRNA